MAGSSLLALIDDIATLLDDVSVMTKVAAKKTSGVLGDDLALNAQQVSGVDPAREIPVVLSVAKGSAINKVILVPVALLLSQFLPILIQPLLVMGGLFLCYEGFEKIFEKALQVLNKGKSLPTAEKVEVVSEQEKIKGAVRTDFILSAEIIVITLGTVATEPLSKQAAVLTAISLIMTIGVYGLVAGIVKLDDLGLWMSRSAKLITQKIGRLILVAAPQLMKLLGIVGTAAMFLVGGGLVVHAVPFLHHIQQGLSMVISTLFDGIVGLLCGAVVVAALHVPQLVKKKV